jgi:hypothetical protein
MSRSRRLAARCLLPLLVLASVTTAHAAVTPERLTAMFAAMNDEGWTGGDASWSTQLPDGRVIWLFGDTFIGGVDVDGRRDPSAPLVRNSMVAQERDGTMRTLIARDARGPAALVAGSGPNDWYWPGPPVVSDRLVQVPMAHIARTGSGEWDFKAVGTSLAVFQLPDLTLQSVTQLVTPPGVNMASAAATSGRFTYVYGTRDGGSRGKDAFVARMPAGELRGPWTYWDGRRWSHDPASATSVAHGVADQFSVLRTGGGWALVSQVPMSRDIVAFRARRPQGAWDEGARIARTPEIAHGITYNATVHPEFSAGKRLILGFCVNADTWSRVFTDAALYRPRFMAVHLARRTASANSPMP